MVKAKETMASESERIRALGLIVNDIMVMEHLESRRDEILENLMTRGKISDDINLDIRFQMGKAAGYSEFLKEIHRSWELMRNLN